MFARVDLAMLKIISMLFAAFQNAMNIENRFGVLHIETSGEAFHRAAGDFPFAFVVSITRDLFDV